MNAAISQLGMLITEDPANDGVAEVIWSALRGMVLAQMIVGSPIDWHRERRALINMVTHYLQNRS
jgi:TetR/AcrR family transcriptional regulator, regulator of cefoperazone and chloramphenicol sensitivity